VVMYMKEPGESVKDLPSPGPAMKLAIYGSAAGTLLLGIFPSAVLNFATRAALR
jgi:hypothetical protein